LPEVKKEVAPEPMDIDPKEPAEADSVANLFSGVDGWVKDSDEETVDSLAMPPIKFSVAPENIKSGMGHLKDEKMLR
jgi:hypothetical protein